ncbi:LOW QUALITY PROTEIN: HAD_2 domain-containing protein, partial [Cephalotus follicularis]
SFASLHPLQAILFDIHGTLCDSDPLHYLAFRQMLQEVGFNDGVPITEDFFIDKIRGKHKDEICGILLPHWDIQRARNFFLDKEAMFRRLATQQLEAVKGLHKLQKWVENRGLKAAVTNSPKPNSHLLISSLGLSDFFDIVVLAEECDRVKPFPDPYLKALQAIDVSHKHAFVFKDSVPVIKAGMEAGMPAVGLGTRRLLTEAGAIFVIKDFEDPKLWTALGELETAEETKITS